MVTSECIIALPWDVGLSCLTLVSAGVDVAVKQSSLASTPVRLAHTPAKALADLGR